MPDVALTIGDRRHVVACRAGQEDQFRRLATMLDAQWPAASRAAGGGGERAMLFVALLLADALDEAEHRTTRAADDAMLEKLADRLESLAASLEN